MSLNTLNSMNLTVNIYRPAAGKTLSANLGQSGDPSLVAQNVRCSIRTRQSSANSSVPGITITAGGIDLNNVANGLFPPNAWIKWENGVAESMLLENDVVKVTKENGVTLSTNEQKRLKFTVQEVQRPTRSRTGTKYQTQAVILKRPELE